ncbi:MAG: two-component system sensor histidine kinase [Rhodobacterales bacterium]|nr:MAG: two-component system sensor histidine kinase [Rhodobacterales bacterium]
MEAIRDKSRRPVRRRRWGLRGVVALLSLVALAVVYVSNQYLTERFTETTRNRAEVRLTLYSGNLVSELQRNSIVPQLLTRDPEISGALASGDYSRSTQRLLSFVDEIGAASLVLLDADGRTVAATDRTRLGSMHRTAAYFVEALRASGTVFTRAERPAGGYVFSYSRKVISGAETLGVIVVEVDLAKLERAWARTSDAVMVMDSAGQIILSTEPRWRGRQESEALEERSPSSAIERALNAAQDWTAMPADGYLSGEAVLRIARRVPFQGWRMISFTPYNSVRERVNAILALEVTGFAILLSLLFLALNRRTARQMSQTERESAELRALNQRLQREIAQREKVEKTLEVAEQTLEQSSKLAALGEMSAAVSHELNQPLAAMKTYLAGARLLVERRRPEEALSAFHRIDDLIGRMGAITKQLKSYARKGGGAFSPVDARAAVATALSMMEPQLKVREVEIDRTLPDHPVMILGDRLRLEQVLINLLRNALDATRAVSDPRIEVILAAGEAVRITVRDNGAGIEDLDALFEPFYTTKQPGDGVGLGLAISSGIVTDLGGRLTARNAVQGGAVFELELPIMAEDDIKAAE